MNNCPCGEPYNEEGTCPKCDQEACDVVDQSTRGLIFPTCYDHKVFDKTCVKCYADSLRSRLALDADRIEELEGKVHKLVSGEMLKVMKTFNISQVRLQALISTVKRAKEAEARTKELEDTLDELGSLMQGVIEGDYKPDSLTLQPAEKVMGKTWENNDEAFED